MNLQYYVYAVVEHEGCFQVKPVFLPDMNNDYTWTTCQIACPCCCDFFYQGKKVSKGP